MKKCFLALNVFLLMVFFGCSAAFRDIKVDAEANPDADFSEYKTFAWGGSAELVVDEEGRWVAPKMDLNAEIRYLVNSELRKRGFTEVNENPDMIVAAAIGVHMDAMAMKTDPKTKMELLQNVPQSALFIADFFADKIGREPVFGYFAPQSRRFAMFIERDTFDGGTVRIQRQIAVDR